MILQVRGAPSASVTVSAISTVTALILLIIKVAHASEAQVLLRDELQRRGPERVLHNRLMENYDKFVRPVKNYSDTVTVTIGVKLNQILDLQEKMQVLTTIVAVDQEWQDQFLQWNPDEFGGLNTTYLPCSQVWLPDIVLYNGVSNIRELPYMQSHVSVRHTGHVVWFPLVKLESACKLDVEFYPFDEQLCHLKFGSWSYSKHEVDVLPGFTGVEKPDYVDSGEFELLSFTVTRKENAYDCCPHPIPTLSVQLHFRRRPLFALFTLAIPCTMLSLMTTVAFVLPPDSSAKIEVQLSVMLSLTVFMLMIGESMPPTSDTLPLLGIHVVIQMGVTALSFICSIVVLRIVKTDHKSMPWRIKHITQLLAKWLFVASFHDDGTCHSQRASTEWKLLLNCTKTLLQSVGARSTCSPVPVVTANGHKLSTPEQLQPQIGIGSSRRTSSYSTQHTAVMSRTSVPVLPREAPEHGSVSGDGMGRYARQIVERMAQTDEKEGRRGDWMLLGLVIDRCLLVVLLLINLCTSLYVYAVAPTRRLPKG